jgi:enoyl-CoA hydratase/carnithine racemase
MISVERKGGSYMCIRFNRPEKANALAVAMMESTTAALAEAASDQKIRAVLLTGAGDRSFSAGADVREQPLDGDMAAHRRRRSDALFVLLNAALDFPKPLIAVLNGVASGAGAMLAFTCDARVAADTSAIALPEINLGIPTYMGAAFAMQIGGLAFAVDLVQTGRRMPAAEALARGLVSCVVPRTELEVAAMRVAADLAAKDSKAFAANKEWLNRSMKAALADAKAATEAHRLGRKT